MIVSTDDDGRKAFRYAWCETCGGPVFGAERVDVPEDLRPGPPKAIAERAEWTVQPCGHGTWSIKDPSSPVFSVALVETAGEGVGLLPSISIAGYDPSRFYEPPVAL